MITRALFFVVAGLGATGCALPLELAMEPPPLADMEEPLAYAQEPPDDSLRNQLPAGGFTGLYVGDPRSSLDDLTAEPAGALVTDVVENSPGDAAGIEKGDLLLWVRSGDSPTRGRLAWPSEWRQVELDAPPGATLVVGYDRAAVEREARIEVVARVRPAARVGVARYRDEEKVGVVVRTATEVEARAAGLGPGGGAVIVGLARGSPWRGAGLRFDDLIVAANDEPVAHPQVVLNAIRDADDAVTLAYVRDGERHTVRAPVTRRAAEMKEFSIPLLYSYQKDRGVEETSILMGLFGLEKTPAAWRCRLLWIITFSGGAADRLEDVGS